MTRDSFGSIAGPLPHELAAEKLPAKLADSGSGSFAPRTGRGRVRTEAGSVEPSRADEFLTQTLKTALALVDVRVLDHLVVAGADVSSFAERGLL